MNDLPAWFNASAPVVGKYEEPQKLERRSGRSDYSPEEEEALRLTDYATDNGQHFSPTGPIEEPMSNFLDRYVPDWRSMSPEERRQELDDLQKQFQFDYDVMGHDDHPEWEYVEINNDRDDLFQEVLRGYRDGRSEPFSFVYYYPSGTAAFPADTSNTSPEREGDRLENTRPNVRSGRNSLDRLNRIGIDIEPASDALDAYEELDRSDYDDAESYADDRTSAWEEFVQAVRDLDETDNDNESFFRKDNKGAPPVAKNHKPSYAQVTGRPLGTFQLTTTAGEKHPTIFILAISTTDNITHLRDIADTWEQDAIQLQDWSGRHTKRTEASRRAQFASDTAFVGAKVLAGDGCCVIVAQEVSTGKVVGVSVYHTFADHSANISLVTVSPDNQPGADSPDQLRGVGTGMICLMAREFKQESITRICLHPLDSQAERFWRRRGFTDYQNQLCVIDNVERLMESCLAPECPDQGESCAIGSYSIVAEYTKPSRR